MTCVVTVTGVLRPVRGPAAGEERNKDEVVGAVGCIGDGFIVRDVVYE